jgi:glycosyltransferase involved in cell wall biosynthesis
MGHLEDVPLLEGCTRAQLREVARISRALQVPAGTVLTRAGEPGEEFFFIIDGRARVHVSPRKRRRMGPGEFFGEISLLDGGPRSATVIAETPMRLLVITRENFATLLDAFARVREGRAARLVILGEGPEEGSLRVRARRLGISADVAFAGFVDNPFAFMARAAVFVLSSAWEGLPSVLIQAMACGCPVVSTDCPSGPAEILERGAYGPLVPVGDAAGLADAIARCPRKCGRSGRGPTRLMWPRSTFQSCGSSSRWVRRRKDPSRVRRGSFAWEAHTGPPASASTTIVRNL